MILNSTDLQRLLLKLVELDYLNSYDKCFIEPTSIKHLSFLLDKQCFKIDTVFINDIYILDKEYLDIHFGFTQNNILCELIWQDEFFRWILQSSNPKIKQIFSKFSFNKSNTIYYASLPKQTNIDFIIKNRLIKLTNIKLKIDYTPNDYFNKVQIYIAIGGKKEDKITKNEFIEALPEFIDKNNIKELEYGFSIILYVQEIPQVITDLVEHKFAIYKVSYI